MRKLTIILVYLLLMMPTAFAAGPYTGIFDNFNDTEGPMTGWGNFYSYMKSNGSAAVAQDSGYSESYWLQFAGNNCEIYGTISVKPEDGQGGQLLLLRNNESGVGITGSGYFVGIDATPGTDTIHLSRYNAITDASTQLGSTVNQEITNGDKIRLAISGSTILVDYKIGAGAWTNIISQTDSTYISGITKLAMASYSVNLAFDDVGGGYFNPNLTVNTDLKINTDFKL